MQASQQWQPLALISIQQKARILQKIRAFFMSEQVLEVMTPVLSPYGVSDPSIESLQLNEHNGSAYLQTSPEFFMKRLLSAGTGSIYQIAHAFRAEEIGRHHLQEFTLLEWYMQDWNYEQLMQQITCLITELAETTVNINTWTYEGVFEQYLGFNPFSISNAGLKQRVDQNLRDLDRDGLLDYCLSIEILPKMNTQGWFFIKDYPATQASLARIKANDARVAERFELFYNGMELANGFSELQDAQIQRQRFEQDNAKRLAAGQSVIPLDDPFLAALQAGLPECAGVALGLERLMMVLFDYEHINQVGLN